VRRRLLRAIAAAFAALGVVKASMSRESGPNDSFEASPTLGQAPLVVTFTGTGSGQLEGVMVLDFGDGQADDSISTIRGFKRIHTYAKAGSYIAELKSGAWGGQRPTVLKTIASVMITVR
jgi:hypothetical protein